MRVCVHELPMNIKLRFRCPSCGFAVFNRRVAKCESCAAPLPANFLFTPADLTLIDAEHERNERVRKDLAREAREIEEKRARRREDSG